MTASNNGSKAELRRLKVLSLYQIMDSASENIFDDLTRLAASICESPISLVSLVDDRRQWFKSSHGLDVTETPRDVAFCAHAIEHDEIMEVENALEDERFLDNPLVLGDPLIRFYAGAPLISAEGERLGTLCVIDSKPKKLDESQLKSLKILSLAVQESLELRRARLLLKNLEKLVPLCAWCKNIRVQEGGDESWLNLVDFIEQSSPVTHGICPDCAVTMGNKDAVD